MSLAFSLDTINLNNDLDVIDNSSGKSGPAGAAMATKKMEKVRTSLVLLSPMDIRFVFNINFNTKIFETYSNSYESLWTIRRRVDTCGKL